MAIKLKEGEVFIDNHWIEHNSLYWVIDRVLTDKEKKTHDIIIKIYISKQARNEKKTPLKSFRINCTKDTLFDTYFSASIISWNWDQFKKSYEYVLNEYKTPENPEWEIFLVFANFESDE